MRQKGIEIAELAREVRKQVHALAATVPHEQTPAYYDGVLGKFCLAGCDTPVTLTPPFEEAKGPVRPPASQKVGGDACNGLRVSLAMSEDKPCIKPGSEDSFRDCADCPEMVVIPAGSFMMGSPKSEPQRSNEAPQHRVNIAKPFAVGKFVCDLCRVGRLRSGWRLRRLSGCSR